MSKLKKQIFIVGLFFPVVVLLSTICWHEYHLSCPELVRLRAVGGIKAIAVNLTTVNAPKTSLRNTTVIMFRKHQQWRWRRK